MFYALNKDGIKVDACMAEREEKYTCPICNNRVVLKKGTLNIDHFAHEANMCSDTWNYDMSKWHKRMQSCFPKEAREVVVSHNGEKHRADVLIGDVVIEFQFSNISAAEFEDRNRFFRSAGYRLAWVFNFSHISEDNLYESEDKENMMIWKHPMRIFANANYLGEKNKNFAIWFSRYGDEEFDKLGEEYIGRVIWAIKNDDGQYSMRRFMTSSCMLIIRDKNEIHPNAFFYSDADFFKERVVELKGKYSFNVKYRGKKGEHRQSYICPRRKESFGIDIWGEHGCLYCRYCYMVARTDNGFGDMYASYCCYPTQVRELCEGHPGYECPQARIFKI